MGAKAAAQADQRRMPVQERSRRRWERIVLTAAELFADRGFEPTTMEAIAHDAGTSIGSVYQFFADKRAVFRAVAALCLERCEAKFRELLGADALSRPWQDVLDTVVDAYAGLSRNDPTYRAVLRNMHLYEEYAEADEALMRRLIDASAALVGHWLPGLPPKRRRVVATVLVETNTALMFMAGRKPARGANAVVAETKLMLRRYLEGM